MRIRRWEECNPWYKFYNRMVTRCNPNRYYGKRGIKVLVTKEDIKEAWYRDKGYLLKHPSLDRINGNGNYSKDNIQFIEFEENMKKRDYSQPYGWEKNGSCLRCKTNIEKHMARGLCVTCYNWVHHHDRKNLCKFKKTRRLRNEMS